MSNPNMYKQASSNNITLDPYPFPSELGMEAYLMDNPSILKLDDRKYGKPQIIECEMSIGKCTNRKRADESTWSFGTAKISSGFWS